MKKNKKIILVASPLGRCGTSAMMGLLKFAGLNIGKNLSKASKFMNSKGFFELVTLRHFYENTFGKYYSKDISILPNIQTLNAFGTNNYIKFNSILKKEFNNKFPAALKSQRFLNLTFFRYLKEYKVYVICMNRKTKGQIASINRVVNVSLDRSLHVPVSYIKYSLLQWKNFANTIRRNYNNFNYLDVNFSKLLTKPVPIMKKVSNFAKIDPPSNKQILNWIDKRLVRFAP
jgi:hypothetical protein